ncbi:MAG: NAD-dependent epimerase/dehydratase family protein [Brevinemataceae bacterium]
MQKVIITGASGFIGKALTKYLLNNNIEVYAIVRDKEKLVDLTHNKNLKIISCEMKGYNTLPEKIKERDFDVCFHLAWEGIVGCEMQNLSTQIKNIENTSSLLYALSKLNIKQFIYADSISQYKYIPINKTTTLYKNFDVYGLSKDFTRKYLIQQISTLDMQFNAVIMSNIFGVGDFSKRSTNIIIDKFLKGESPALADGSILYDWVYIDDAIQVMLAVVDKGHPYKTYYIGYRKLKTFEEIVTTVRDIVNPTIPLTFGTYHDTSFIDYDQFFNDDLYQDTGFEIRSDFAENIKKTTEWVKFLNF